MPHDRGTPQPRAGEDGAGGDGAARPVALVTGASRGIGRACAVALARAGFDVAVSARTVDDGERREHSPTVHRRDDSPLPGSLRATAAEVRAAGGDALLVPADLLDHASLQAAAAAVLERWRRCDVVVHNGRYVGPGHMDRLLDTPPALIDAALHANVTGAVVLTQALLPSMIERGGGTVVTITSAVAYADPLLPAGQGGWGLSYGASKAALHRLAGLLRAEHGADGIRAFNVQPGMIDAERVLLETAVSGFGGWGAPPEVVGAVVAWLCTDPRADALQERTVEAQFVCHERGLLPGWPGPRPSKAQLRPDDSGGALRDLEASIAPDAAHHDMPSSSG